LWGRALCWEVVSGLQLADRKADMMQVCHCSVLTGGAAKGAGRRIVGEGWEVVSGLQLADRKADMMQVSVCVGTYDSKHSNDHTYTTRRG
jgi:hypothetical protein